MASMPPASPSPRTGSLDETLASLGAGAAGLGVDGELPLDRGDLIGRYVVLEEVGRGAMGLVVSAYDPELDRKIALKLMHVGPGKLGASSARLVREAQAMARLSHPNVITVHDVGTAGDDVFIAMEFVEGGSLREWLRARTRPWQDIVRMFIAAGEGLAAAHRQGLVHRDFKPDNVLVRDDKRPCVGDFGLARQDQSAPASDDLDDMRSTLGSLTAGPAERALAARGSATMTGATMGTPAYMAPEQHLRVTVDHRCDQFAFCVALWEALAGERPFAGTTLGAIALNVTTNKRRPFPRDSAVPGRARAALERGLSIRPEQRFASMTKLLDELRASLRTTGRWSRDALIALVVACLGGAGLIAAGLVYSSNNSGAAIIETGPTPSSLCSRADEQMIGVWDPQLEADVARAFARAEQRYLRDSFTRVAASLEHKRGAWIKAHTRACEATRVYGEQSEELLDRRMICLAQRRNELAAVSAALAAGSPEAIVSADKLLAGIGSIDSCDDLLVLEAGLPPPPTAQREPVEGIRSRLAELTVMRRAGDPVQAKQLASRLVDEAKAAAYEPVLAEALVAQASVLEQGAGPVEALPVARRAAITATAAGHRLELVRALSLLAWIEGTGRANFELGLWLLELAEAELPALGEPVMLALQVKSDRAAILLGQGQFQAGLVAFEQALAFAEAELGPEHIRAADLRFNIGATHHYLGHNELAEQAFRASLEVYTRLVGPDHPEVAQCHNNLAAVLAARGQADEAERHTKRAIEIWQANGSDNFLTGAYGNLGDVARLRQDYEQALTMYEQAYTLKREVFGSEHPTTLSSLGAVAFALMELKRYDEAEAHFVDGITRLRAAAGPEHPDELEMRMHLVELARRRGHELDALAQLDELQQLAAPDDADRRHLLLSILLLRAQIEHTRGKVELALAALDQADALFEVGVEEQLQASATQLRAQLEAL